jgi:hypothetical protein
MLGASLAQLAARRLRGLRGSLRVPVSNSTTLS